MHRFRQKSDKAIEKLAIKTTNWIGSTGSIVIHTLLFIIAFALYFYGIQIDKILLIVTTIVSLEAIYLSIFIQMSVNRQSKEFQDVAEDIDEIQKDIDDIQEDVEDIQEDDENDNAKKDDMMMVRIEKTLGKLIEEVMDLKKQQEKEHSKNKKDR